jgi:hypothetical protein
MRQTRQRAASSTLRATFLPTTSSPSGGMRSVKRAKADLIASSVAVVVEVVGFDVRDRGARGRSCRNERSYSQASTLNQPPSSHEVERSAERPADAADERAGRGARAERCCAMPASAW